MTDSKGKTRSDDESSQSTDDLDIRAEAHLSLVDKEDHDDVMERLEQELDDDFDIAALREKRFQEMQQAMKRLVEMVQSGYREVTEITDEKEVIRLSASEKRCVIHFYHKDFKRCEVMNKHLEVLARKYFATRFLKVFVENIPWLVEKLEIKVLPCVVCFLNGVTKARLVGFEALGNNDEFQTGALDLWLQQAGVVVPPETPLRAMMGTSSSPPSSSKIRDANPRYDEDEDDWD